MVLNYSIFILVSLTSFISQLNGEKSQLNEFISHYEPLSYDTSQIKQSHARVKRWIKNIHSENKEPEVELNFNAHGIDFKIRLKKDTSQFTNNFDLIIDEDKSFLNNFHLYKGHLEDIDGSEVHGSLHGGVFEGKISLPTGHVFYVENSNKFPIILNKTQHSVIYSQNDIVHSHEHLNKKIKPCPESDSNVQKWLKNVQSSKIGDEKISRNKRADKNSSQRTTCTLHIRTDPMFWKFISKQESQLGRNEKSFVTEEILSIVGQHVKVLNDIFSNTLFEGELKHRNIQFVVQRVKIDTDEDCYVGNNTNFQSPTNPFCAENIDVSNFLDLHSRTKYDDFCLSYIFTYRDFTGGVVGLAWVASSQISGSAGGICEKYSSYSGFSSKRSLNTGIVTFLNYNRRLPPRLSTLTFVHEVGHNFGSPHDSDECQPGGTDGNYLMFSSATSGYLRNNDRFSECSINKISSVLDRVVQEKGKSINCFEDTQSTFCGNQIAEEGEECDCGFDQKDCTDKCCTPRRFSNSSTDSLHSNRCKRTEGSECSPTQGPCCNESTCSFIPNASLEQDGVLCAKETECSQSAYCSGESAICPKPDWKPDNITLCNRESQVCISGECRGSLCIKYGLEECSLSSTDYSDKKTLCTLACLSDGGKCTPSFDIPEIGKIKLPPGTPCDNFRGYCDVFSKCRKVDEQGPLLRLTKILINKQNYNNAVEWIKGNPFWTGFFGILFIILMAGFIKCCAVHTPSSSPYLPHHLKFTDTLRKPIDTLKRRPRNGERRGRDEVEMRGLRQGDRMQRYNISSRYH